MSAETGRRDAGAPARAAGPAGEALGAQGARGAPEGDGPIVLVLEPVAAAGLDLLTGAGLTVVRGDLLDPPARAAALRRADAVLVRSGTRVDQALLDAAPCLRAIARAGVGLDNVDVEAATRRGIAVMNTPGGNANAAAELTFAVLLSLVRRVAIAHASLARGEWKRHEFVGTELAGKTLGIVGLGRIGTLVAARARAFQMQVVSHDPFLSTERARAMGVDMVPLDELLACADVVSLHVPLTEGTRNLVSEQRLATMKRSAVLVNCARGGLVDEQALAVALREGRLAGAAVDVFAHEPPTDSPLLGLPNVVHTPHLGASTREATENVAVTVAEALLSYLRDGDLSAAVNLPYAGSQLRALAPWLDLAQRLGRFQAGLLDGAPTRVEIDVASDEPMETAPLASAFLCGLLREACGEEVNVVNARLKATDRGITVTEGRGPAVEGYARRLRASLHEPGRSHVVEGTVSSPGAPRLLRVDGYAMDVQAAGTYLVMTNDDVPGVMGSVGTLLGRHRINIGELRLGRSARPHKAMSLWQLDQPAPAEVLAELRALEAVAECRQVRLGAPPA